MNNSGGKFEKCNKKRKRNNQKKKKEKENKNDGETCRQSLRTGKNPENNYQTI